MSRDSFCDSVMAICSCCWNRRSLSDSGDLFSGDRLVPGDAATTGEGAMAALTCFLCVAERWAIMAIRVSKPCLQTVQGKGPPRRIGKDGFRGGSLAAGRLVLSVSAVAGAGAAGLRRRWEDAGELEPAFFDKFSSKSLRFLKEILVLSVALTSPTTITPSVLFQQDRYWHLLPAALLVQLAH